MPSCVDYPYGLYRPTVWSEMERWQRKAFHRENESRARNGLAPLPKPMNPVPSKHGI